MSEGDRNRIGKWLISALVVNQGVVIVGVVKPIGCHADKEPEFLLEEMNAARKRENESVEAGFAEVLNQISMSKAFRQQIYNLFKYKNTACFFKSVQV